MKVRFCYCGLVSDLKMSRTPNNSGRRFWGCQRYASNGFFATLAPALTPPLAPTPVVDEAPTVAAVVVEVVALALAVPEELAPVGGPFTAL
ncbi:hypothetical protein K7X08_015205 [Anisodus acutangulus]|uniref:Zinc finger GRF-type domain-containing protein n=1 Tax=Anisodus acutangulus TaxID=402998 RepID=A0A9Q1L408_9SOLA|nr:hypothetical protein K7X08_015205 [Anisodus acutangulus]